MPICNSDKLEISIKILIVITIIFCLILYLITLGWEMESFIVIICLSFILMLIFIIFVIKLINCLTAIYKIKKSVNLEKNCLLSNSDNEKIFII